MSNTIQSIGGDNKICLQEDNNGIKEKNISFKTSNHGEGISNSHLQKKRTIGSSAALADKTKAVLETKKQMVKITDGFKEELEGASTLFQKAKFFIQNYSEFKANVFKALENLKNDIANEDLKTAFENFFNSIADAFEQATMEAVGEKFKNMGKNILKGNFQDAKKEAREIVERGVEQMEKDVDKFLKNIKQFANNLQK